MEYEMSKSTMRRAKRLDNQIGETFKEYQARKQLAESAAVDAENAIVESSLKLQNQKFTRAREHERAANKAMLYENTVNVIGLTEMLTRVVENSLLLDLDEYQSINEGYHDFIKNTVEGFLKNAEINADIRNENTLGLYEAVQAYKPSREVGLCLTEEELQDEYGELPYEVGDKYIEAMSGDVMDRVATMVDADQKVAADIDGNLNAIAGLEESTFVRNDQPAKTVLEVFALNEATQMVNEGKEYNADLALANAITYLTILETLDASGLVTIGKKGYHDILEAVGVKQTKALDSRKNRALTETEVKEVKKNVNEYSSLVEEARHAGFKSFSEWKSKRVTLTEATPAATEKKYDYSYNGKNYTKDEVVTMLENQGFDFDVDDFNDIVHSNGFRKL